MSLMPQSAIRAASVLGLFSVFCLGLVTCVHGLTQERIASNQRLRLLQSMEALAPKADHDNDLLNDFIDLPGASIGSAKQMRIYRARRASKPVAAVFSVSTQEAYSGEISLLVGLKPDGTLAGVRVIEHKETPGLGDLIEEDKSDWILKFAGLSLAKPDGASWKVKRDGGAFDQFTGATVTPRAIVKCVRDVLVYFTANKEAVFAGQSF